MGNFYITPKPKTIIILVSRYKVYKIVTKTEAEAALLRTFESNENFDFWSSINKVGKPISVMVAPNAQSQFEFILKTTKMHFSVEIEDVER